MGARLTALGVLARWFGLPLPGATVRRREVTLARTGTGLPIEGMLWEPPEPGPALVLAAGVTPLGVDDPRLLRVGDAVAGGGRLVFAPNFALSDRRLDPGDVDRIAGSVRALAVHDRGDGRVTILGFSFGGSYALVAAGDPTVRSSLDRVAAFGAYADLRRLLPRLREHLDPAAVRSALEELTDAGEGEGPLDRDEADAVEALVTGRLDPVGLPGSLSRRLDRLSPITAAGRVEAEIVLMHALHDPVIPVAELDALRRCFPHAESHLVRSFTHVDFRPDPRRFVDGARDLWALWRFTTAVVGR